VFQGMRSEGSAPVLRLLGQRSGTGTWRQSAQAYSQKHRVPGTYSTYVITPDIRTRGALYAGLLSSWVRVASCMCRTSETTAPSEGRVVCKALMPRGRVRIARVRRCRE
jgi:hypothetical protein